MLGGHDKKCLPSKKAQISVNAKKCKLGNMIIFIDEMQATKIMIIKDPMMLYPEKWPFLVTSFRLSFVMLSEGVLLLLAFESWRSSPHDVLFKTDLYSLKFKTLLLLMILKVEIVLFNIYIYYNHFRF